MSKINLPRDSTLQEILAVIQEQSETQMKIAEEIADGLDVDLSGYSTTEEMTAAIQAAVEGIGLSAYSTTEEMNSAIASAVSESGHITAEEAQSLIDSAVSTAISSAVSTAVDSAVSGALEEALDADDVATEEEVSEVLAEVFGE